MGATASGKTALSIKLAQANGGEILCVDSRQFYSEMSLGTCAPTQTEKTLVIHHGLNFLNPNESYSTDKFVEEFGHHLTRQTETPLIIVGGSGLYLSKLLLESTPARSPASPEIQEKVKTLESTLKNQGFHDFLKAHDPLRSQQIHPHDRYRIAKALENYFCTGQSYTLQKNDKKWKESILSRNVYCLNLPRERLFQRIKERTSQLLHCGWLQEVEVLINKGYDFELPAFQAIGYREIQQYHRGKVTLDELRKDIVQKTQKYAKRQTFFFKSQFPEMNILGKSGEESEISTFFKG